MHQAASTYVASVVDLVPESGAAVEFGSLDVNGSARRHFPGYNFYGIDLRAGDNVDEVCDARDFDGGEGYDLVLCTEMLEHTPRPWEIIDAARKALRPGGVLVLTAAAPDRTPHCTNGGHYVPPDQHYENIEPEALEGWLKDWEVLDLRHSRADGDVYATAKRIA